MRLDLRYITFLLILIPVLSIGQGSKTLVRNAVSSQVTYEYFIADGIKEPVVEKIEAYDAEGNVIERKEFNSDGEVKKWEAFTYDENGDVTEEKFMDEKGRVVERITYSYIDRLVQEKKYYDHKDRMVKRKTYAYKYREE